MVGSGLGDFQLGDLLGRGASGNVYRAINFLTGETVAIKSVSVQSLPASQLPEIMSEIELLKNLNHPNIVKYKGFTKDKDTLFIILEYCENGSLQTILKKFGKFPESLAAVYVCQVLEGLIYLHDQGVIHRDIKGANILTNKDGSVKLADFGVSARTTQPDIAAVANPDAADNEVVGSPYWMAPEVIEQNGATSASDIWSVGCVIVELLEGKPPYGDLTPMQALWRIVQDESMRIPEGASPIVKDFLYQCFQKDPNLRISAKKLLRHPWMQTARRNQGDNSGGQTTPKIKSRASHNAQASIKLPAPREAIQRVQQWNEALNASNTGTMRALRRDRDNNALNRSRTDPVTPVVAAPSAGGGLILKNQYVSEVLNRARENSETEKWDDDFAFDETTISPLRKPPVPVDDDDADTATVRPRQLFKSKPAPAPRLSGIEEDYSDLGIDEDDLETKLSNMKLRHKGENGRIKLMRPSDLQKISAQAPAPKPSPSLVVASPKIPLVLTPSPPSSAQALGKGTPPGSRNSSLRGRKATSESNPELQKYTEADDEDFSDMFDGPAADGVVALPSLQLTRRSNSSWQEEDDEEQDPFAEFDDFDVDDAANLLQNKKAALWAAVERIVSQMQVSPTLPELCEELLDMLENASPDMGLERHFVQVHGMLTVLGLLEGKPPREAAIRLLRIVNFVVACDVDNLESFCMVGGIPAITPYTNKKHSLETRLEAATFIQHLTRHAPTLQMFISCRGLKVLVELLDEDYANQKPLILSALEGISSVFDLQSPMPKPDFCRMFTREGILDPLATALLAVIKDPDVVDETPRRAMEVVLLFSQVAQADENVRQGFEARAIMMRLLRTLDLLPNMSLVTATKAIKHLATHPKLIEVLQHSNAVEVLVNLLGKSLIGSYSNEICANIFQAIFYMCRFSKARVEEAATAGIIPMLKRTIENKSPLKQFALPILYDLADAGKVARRLLRQNDGLKVYLNLLDEPYGRKAVLDAVVKLTDDPERTEDPLPLLTLESINGLAKCFPQSSSGEYSLILDLYVQLFRNVPGLITAASAQFLPRVSDALDKQLNPNAKLSLLRLMRILLETHPHREALVARHDFDNKVDPLTRDTSVLVRELAREVYQVIVFGYQPPPSTNSAPAPASLAPPAQSVLGTVPAKRVFSVRRPSGSRSSGSGSGGGSSSGSAANPRGARLRVPSSLSAMGTSHLANANVDLNDNSKLSPSDDADKFPSPLDSGPTSSILASAEVVSLSRSGIPRSKRHTSRKLSADLSVPRDENSNAVLGNGNGNGNGNSNGIGNGHGHAHPHGHGHGRTSSRSSRASMPWPSKSPREYALSLPDVKS